MTGRNARRGMEEVVRRPASEFACRRDLALPYLHVLVAADYPDPIDEVLRYAVPESEGQGPIVEVTYTICAPVVDALAVVARRSGMKVENKPGLHYYRSDHEGLTYFASDVGDGEESHVVVTDGHRYAIVAREATAVGARRPLRIVRELVLRAHENAGGCFAHAAAVVRGRDQAGLLIVGPAASGKTTLMWSLLALPGSGYVANDRVILHDRPLRAYGWPLAVRIGIGTLGSATTKTLTQLALSRPQDSAIMSGASNELNDLRRWGSRRKLELTPAEVAGLTGASLHPSTTLQGVIIANLRTDRDQLTISRATPGRLRAILRDTIRSPLDPEYLRGWLDRRTVAENDLRTMAERIADRLSDLPVVEVAGDPAALPQRVDEISKSLES